MHYLQTQHHLYAQPQNATYSTWPNSLDYSSLSTAPASVPWSNGSYSSTYPMYENESTNAYATKPPSYMLPDPDHGVRHNMSYMSSMSRPQQNSLWLEQMNSASVPQQVSPVYPLTPAESTKSYLVLKTQPGQHALSNERTLPQPTLSGVASLPSNGHETPPLSAVSHRSSHTWNTDTASHISNASSRTSCGGSQDLSAAVQGLTTCEDQAAIYPYPADTTSPIIDIPAAALPTTSDDDQQQQLQRVTSTVSETGALLLHNCASRERLGNSSPTNGLYGYTNTRSSRVTNSMMTTRLLTSDFPNGWNASPTSNRNNSLTSHQVNEVNSTNPFPEHRGSSTPLNGGQLY